MAENLNIFGTIYSDVSGIKAYDENGDIQTYIKPEGNILINTTGQIDVSHYATASANMAALINNQNKEVTPSVLQQEIYADTGYTGLNKVTVNAMSRGSATTPDTTITTTPTISVDNNGLITATNSKTQSVTPSVVAGYIATGTAGTITVEGSNTQQLTTQGAATYTPTTTNQTIASGTYLTGVQTIAGDADLVPSNIKKDVNIFGVTGTYETLPDVESLTVTPTESKQIFYGSAGELITTEWLTPVSSGGVAKSLPLVAGKIYFIDIELEDGVGYPVSLNDSKHWRFVWDGSAIISHNIYNTASTPVKVAVLTISENANVTLSSTNAMSLDGGSISLYNADYNAYKPVTVNAIPSEYIVPTGTINITQNGTVNVSQYASATIAVAGSSAIADEVIPLVNGGDHHSITGVDLSFDTVTASSMLLGTTAHDSAGNAITGTYIPNSDDNKTIKFIDYDGTVLHEYTPAEFAQLDSLPRNPTPGRHPSLLNSTSESAQRESDLRAGG